MYVKYDICYYICSNKHHALNIIQIINNTTKGNKWQHSPNYVYDYMRAYMQRASLYKHKKLIQKTPKNTKKHQKNTKKTPKKYI